MCVTANSIAILSECTIINSVSATNGGALFLRQSVAHLVGCNLINSLACMWGGALFLTYESTVEVTNCKVSNSSAAALGQRSAYGGAVYLKEYCKAHLVGCTLATS
eukprot:2466128-Prymnesium_polylepis.1